MNTGRSMENKVDEIFGNALRGKGCEPPQEMWGKIESAVYRPKRTAAFWWKPAVAAAALLAFGAGLLLDGPEVSPGDNPLVSRPLSVSICPVGGTAGPAGYLPSRLQYHEHGGMTVRESIRKPEDMALPAVPAACREAVPLEICSARPVLAELQIREIIPLVSGEAFANNDRYREILAGNGVDETEREDPPLVLALSGHLAPSIASGQYSSEVRDLLASRYSDDRMERLKSVGGGIRLSVSRGRRITLRTGLSYTGMGQKSSTSPHGRTLGAVMEMSGKKRTCTPLGNVRMKKRFGGGELSAASLFSFQEGESVEQRFGMLEVPLNLQYRLIQKKLSLFVSGGLSGGFMVLNKVVLAGDGKKEWIGRTRDIRRFNLSTDFSVGLEYAWGNRLSFSFEPGLRYYLQSLSKNSDISFRPCLFSLSTGIGIRL